MQKSITFVLLLKKKENQFYSYLKAHYCIGKAVLCPVCFIMWPHTAKWQFEIFCSVKILQFDIQSRSQEHPTPLKDLQTSLADFLSLLFTVNAYSKWKEKVQRKINLHYIFIKKCSVTLFILFQFSTLTNCSCVMRSF